MPREKILSRLLDSGIIAIIRAPSDAQLGHIASALVEGGITAVEITMTTPNALRAIATLSETFGENALIGVGSVMDEKTAIEAIHAGAQFVVSPAFLPRVVETTRRLEKISIPGAYTPTEILTAWNAGADFVKVFPATGLGPTYFRDILAPMPFLKLIPTGGVDLKSAPDWIKAGAALLGAGSSLLPKEALIQNDWPAITAAARELAQAAKSARLPR